MATHRKNTATREVRGDSEALEVFTKQAGCTKKRRTEILAGDTNFFPEEADTETNKAVNGFLMMIMQLVPINMKDPSELSQRLAEYINICYKCGAKPSLASLALALGCDRSMILQFKKGHDGRGKALPVECCDMIRRAYVLLNASLEQSMMENKIQQVSGIFLLKANFGYKDDQTILADQESDQTNERARKAQEYKTMLENSK